MSPSPAVRVPVQCAQLFTTAEAVKLVGYPVTVKSNETTTPTDISSIAARQHGTLVCIWGGSDSAGEYSGYGEQLEIDVAVDAKAAYQKYVPGLDAVDPPLYANIAGSSSSATCGTDGFLLCGGNMLVDQYWASASLLNENDSRVALPDAAARIKRVMTTVASALSHTHASKKWSGPTPALPTVCAAPGSREKLQSILGVPQLKAEAFTLNEVDAFYLAETGPDNVSCHWRASDYKPLRVAGFDQVSFQILQGGAWALQALARSPRTDITYGTYGRVTIRGASAAVLSCKPIACSAILAVGGNLVQLYLEPGFDTKGRNPSHARTIAAITELVAELIVT